MGAFFEKEQTHPLLAKAIDEGTRQSRTWMQHENIVLALMGYPEIRAILDFWQSKAKQEEWPSEYWPPYRKASNIVEWFSKDWGNSEITDDQFPYRTQFNRVNKGRWWMYRVKV